MATWGLWYFRNINNFDTSLKEGINYYEKGMSLIHKKLMMIRVITCICNKTTIPI